MRRQVMFGWLKSRSVENAKTGGESRSPQWPTVRRKFLEGKVCAACGGTEQLEAHHLVPFSVDRNRELNPENLLALCEHPARLCHFRVGHRYRWASYSRHATEDAELDRKRLEERVNP